MHGYGLYSVCQPFEEYYLKIPIDVPMYNTSLSSDESDKAWDILGRVSHASQPDGSCALLFGPACGPARNCTAACLSPELAFADPFTLLNCMAYSVFSDLISSGNLSRQGLEATFAMGFTNTSFRLKDAVSNTINTCTNQYLSTSRNTRQPQLYSDIKFLSLNTTYTYPNICNGDLPTVDAEVAGIGAFISFFLQAGLSISTFLLIQMFHSWAPKIASLYPSVRPGCPKAAEEYAKNLGTRLRRYLDPLVTATIDFQKLQCYYQLAIQVAIIRTVSGKSFPLKYSSTQQFWNNLYFFRTIPLSGIVPISLTLNSLYTVRKCSTYVIILSLCTILLSTVAIQQTSVLEVQREAGDVPAISEQQQFGGFIPSCGAVNPIRFCHTAGASSPEDFQYPVTGKTPLLIFYWLVLAHVIVVRVAQSTVQRYRSNNSDFSSMTSADPIWMPNVNRSIPRISDLCWHITFMIVSFNGFLFYLKTLLDLNKQSVLNTTDWGFGQIVTVTVFVPSIVELFYLQLRGLKNGSQYRLSDRYAVLDVHSTNRNTPQLPQVTTNQGKELKQSKTQRFFVPKTKAGKIFRLGFYITSFSLCASKIVVVVFFLFCSPRKRYEKMKES